MIVWLGHRQGFGLSDDYDAFCRVSTEALPRVSQFYVNRTEEDHELLGEMTSDLSKGLDRIHFPLAVFVVVSERVAEERWSDRFCQAIREHRLRTQEDDNTGVYKIILGGGQGFAKQGTWIPESILDPDEIRAQELNGVYIHFNMDAPTAGSYRLTEFMQRVMGLDLPGAFYPGYSFEELQKIAWNINRENFNFGSPREGAIPKYEIAKGHPIFPW